MKNLIILALDNAMNKLDRITPSTKKVERTISILDVSPLHLVQFMMDNNIPDDACFSGRDNGYDAWDDILLSWDVDVPTTDKDKLTYRRKQFTTTAFKFVHDTLIENGFKRVGYSSGLLKEFDDTTVYDMYINKDFDRLVKYYSLPFNKVIE
jgi:hypothetical protein